VGYVPRWSARTTPAPSSVDPKPRVSGDGGKFMATIEPAPPQGPHHPAAALPHLHPDPGRTTLRDLLHQGRQTDPAALMADRPPAPPPLRQALRTIDQHIDDYLNHARLPTAASKPGSTCGARKRGCGYAACAYSLISRSWPVSGRPGRDEIGGTVRLTSWRTVPSSPLISRTLGACHRNPGLLP
jgi:hypothetical protein